MHDSGRTVGALTPGLTFVALIGALALFTGFFMPCPRGRRRTLVTFGVVIALFAVGALAVGSRLWAALPVVAVSAGFVLQLALAIGWTPPRLPRVAVGSEAQPLDLEFPAKILVRWRGPFLCTDFLADLSSPLHLRIASRGWVGEFFSESRLGAVNVGAWTYAVHSTDSAFASALLTGPARRQIEELDRLHEGALLVEQRPTTFVVRAEGRVEDGVQMNEFVRLAAAIARRIRDLTPSERQQEIAKATCGVCGTELGYRTVTCAGCDTPHHRECWEYNGGCSVYACGGTSKAD